MDRRNFLRRIMGLASVMALAPLARFLPAPKALRPSDVSDFVAATLRDLGKPKWTDISTDLQRRTAFRALLSRRRVVLETKEECVWNVPLKENSAGTLT